MPAPVIFTRPADIELAEDPIPANWVIQGAPQIRSKRIAESGDGTSSVLVWSCTAGRFNWYYSVEETLHIIAGEVFVTDETGHILRLGSGDMAFFPAGSRSIWHVPQYVLKLAVCRHRMPRPLGLALRAWHKVMDTVTGFSAGRAAPQGQSSSRAADAHTRTA